MFNPSFLLIETLFYLILVFELDATLLFALVSIRSIDLGNRKNLDKENRNYITHCGRNHNFATVYRLTTISDTGQQASPLTAFEIIYISDQK